VEGLSVMDMIHQGWYVSYPLIIMSVVCITIILERLWNLGGIMTKTLHLARDLVSPLQQGDFNTALETSQADNKLPAGRVFREIIARQRDESPEQLSSLADERRLEESEGLKGAIWILATTGVSAPFIGLLGTVIGIIKSFQQMAVEGSGGFTVVAGGISEALVATALGLAVAIIAVIFYNYFNTKLERIDTAMTIGSDRIIDAIRIGRKEAAQAA